MKNATEARSLDMRTRIEKVRLLTCFSLRFFAMMLLAVSAFVLLPFMAVSHAPDDPLVADWGLISSANHQGLIVQMVTTFCAPELFRVRVVAALLYGCLVCVTESIDDPLKCGFYVLCWNNIVIMSMIAGCAIWV